MLSVNIDETVRLFVRFNLVENTDVIQSENRHKTTHSVHSNYWAKIVDVDVVGEKLFMPQYVVKCSVYLG